MNGEGRYKEEASPTSETDQCGRRSSEQKSTSKVTKSAAKDGPMKSCQPEKLFGRGKGVSDQKVTLTVTDKSVAPKSARVKVGKK